MTVLHEEGGVVSMKRKAAVFMCLILVSSMMLTTAAVSAKKPDKPPGKPGGGDDTGPTGTIFFHMYDDNDDLYIWTIEPDGTDKTKENLIVSGVQSLSWEMHNGHYWYVGLITITGETYPDGLPRQELYAIRDDNTMGFQMTDDEDMAFSPTDQGEQLLWVPGDVYLSWVGKVWTDLGGGTYTCDGYGIYRAEVQYDNDGDVSGLGDPDFVYDTGSYYDEYDDVDYPNVHGYDWSPDGDEIAIQMHDNYIYIDSIDGDSPTQLVSGFGPKWSPDGTRIAFERSKEILVIDVDGTDETSLEKVSNTRITTVRGVWGYEWSPDGKYVVYTIWEHNLHNWGQKTKMYTIEPDGSGRSSISGTLVRTWNYSRDSR